MATLEITQKVKDEYGTLKHYAKIKELDYRLLRQVALGKKVSKKCVEALKKDGFIQ
ncbi:MAG: hypothetical protein PHE60_07630 [Sulfurospirillaceae bacterium]|nr:hypothetical protein [Sulfurospirillaceae bacterium]